MEYQANNLPYGLFEKIGMNKKDVLNLPANDLKALLQGRTTSLMDLNFNIEGIDLKERAKISLYTLPDNSVGIKVHPYRKELKNEYDFSPSEIGMLKNGEVIAKTKTSLNGEKEKHLFQLDRDINEIKSIRVKDVNIPKFMEGIELTRAQKDELLKGASAVIADEKTSKVIRIDLVNTTGYTIREAKTPEVTPLLHKEKISSLEEGKTRSLDKPVAASLKSDITSDPARIRTNGMHR